MVIDALEDIRKIGICGCGPGARRGYPPIRHSSSKTCLLLGRATLPVLVGPGSYLTLRKGFEDSFRGLDVDCDCWDCVDGCAVESIGHRGRKGSVAEINFRSCGSVCSFPRECVLRAWKPWNAQDSECPCVMVAGMPASIQGNIQKEKKSLVQINDIR